MRRLAFLLAALAVTFAPPASAAPATVTVAPDCCGFTAQFPDTPDVKTPAPTTLAMLGGGAKVQTRLFVKPEANFIALISVDLYEDDTRIADPVALFGTERDSFIAAFQGTLSGTHAGKYRGAPAMFFDFAARGGKGRGMIVLGGGSAPRVFLVTTYTRPAANEDEIAQSNAFFNSFRLVQ